VKGLKMPVKYGIIGCGAIGQRRHIPECNNNPKSAVGALCDPVKGRAASLAETYGGEAYTDHKKMLKNADIDAVVVCGPNSLHASQTIDALRAGKHVLCEKPMATTRADAKKMISTAKKAGKFLMVGQNQRLMAPHVRAKEILKSGKLGNVLAFRTAFKHPGPEGWSVDGASSWFFKKGSAIMGTTGDLGVHKADLMRWLLDEEFDQVGGLITTRDKRDGKGKLIPLDDNAYLTLQTKSGVVGSMILSWTNYGSEENYTVVYCSKGVLRLGDDPDFGVVVEYANGDLEKHSVGEISTNEKQVASGIIDSFTRSISRKKAPEIDGFEGYQSLNVILTAMDAAKQKKMLKISNLKK
jgi:UDP-N-acetylglucosamine 3-dehydrogenase